MSEEDVTEQDWKFDLDDLDTEEASGDTSETEYTPGAASIALLPFSLVGILAFVETSAVAGAMQSLFGAGVFATVVTKTFLVMGTISVAFIVLGLLLVAIALIGAVALRSKGAAAIGLLGVLLYGSAVGGALFLFPSLPLLVGMVLSVTAYIYIGTALAALAGGIIALTQLT